MPCTTQGHLSCSSHCAFVIIQITFWLLTVKCLKKETHFSNWHKVIFVMAAGPLGVPGGAGKALREQARKVAGSDQFNLRLSLLSLIVVRRGPGQGGQRQKGRIVVRMSCCQGPGHKCCGLGPEKVPAHLKVGDMVPTALTGPWLQFPRTSCVSWRACWSPL